MHRRIIMNVSEKVIIYGYSSVGEAVYQECVATGIQVICYCEDNKIRRDNADSSSTPVMSLDEIAETNIDGLFIICIPDAMPVIRKLENFGYEHWQLIDDFFEKDCYMRYIYIRKSHTESIKEIESCILSHKFLFQKDKLFLRNVDVEITEKCSLKCRDCSNLMAYYKVPKSYPAEQILENLRSLLEYVDEIYEVRILGGEPFMHQDIHTIVENILKIKGIHRILIYSNGTVFPSENMWEVMENDRVGLSITDYGKLSRKLHRIQQELEKRRISYDIHEAGSWTQCSTIYEHGRTDEELKEMYKECCAKNLTTLLDGAVYKCPFLANAANLGAIFLGEDEFIGLNELALMSSEAAKEKIKYFLKEKDIFRGCDYCEGRSFGAEEIEPAVQIKSPRKIGER